MVKRLHSGRSWSNVVYQCVHVFKEKTMKRKLMILSFILFGLCNVVFLSCKQKNVEAKTSLVIKNQSSAILRAFKYDGELLVGENDGAIPTAEKAEIHLEGESSGYLFFLIVDSKHDREIRVRSSEVITVKKGECHTFLITDHTTVIPLNEGNLSAFTVFSMLHPASLRVVNQTATSISDISFGGKQQNTTIPKRSAWDANFNSEVSDKLSFKLWDANNNTIEVVLRDEITLKADKTKEVILENDSLVIKDKGTGADPIKTVLGLSVVTIVNASSTEISNLELGAESKETLAKNDSWDAGFFNSIDEILSFDVQVRSKKFSLKCEEKMKCNKGETIPFRITDDTQVKLENRTLKLSEVLNASFLTISNETCLDLDVLKFAGLEAGTVAKNSKKELVIFDFSNFPDHIQFSFIPDSSSTAVQLKTKDRVFIDRGQEKVYVINKNRKL